MLRTAGAALVVASAGLGFASSAHADDLAAIKARGYARGVIANEKPYGYIDSAGKAVGIGPDIANAIMPSIGIQKIEWTVVAFNGLIPGVKANRFDFAAAEQAIRPERCAQVAFSSPTSSYGVNLLVKKGNPKNIHSYEDFKKNTELKLAFVAGGTEKLIDAYVTKDQRVYIHSNVDAIAALTSGRADAYDATELTNHDLAKMSSEVEVPKLTSDPVVDGKPYRSFGAFSFRKEDQGFFDAVNKALIEFKKTDAYEKILTQYGLSTASVEQARKETTADACAGK